MKKYISNLSYYLYFGNLVTKGPSVTWYVADDADEDGEAGRGFTDDELAQFQSFVNQHPLNFEGPKNVHIMTEDENLYFSMWSFLERDNYPMPRNMFLRRDYTLAEEGIAESMDVILTNHTGSEIAYTLDFDVVAVIN